MENGHEPVIFCKKCEVNRPVSEFYVSKKTGKYVYPCKMCKREYYRQWTSNNGDYHKKWKTDNKDKVKEHNKRYRERRKALDDA